MFKTPDISHLTQNDFFNVYEPAEDTFLLLDALEKEYEYLKNKRPSICLEVGCGSGVCITFLSKILGPTTATYWCTDINSAATDVARRTAEQNNTIVQPVITDLTESLQERLNHQVDVLLFNPPYVVTPSCEVSSNGIEASWAGGDDGRQVIDRFLPKVPDLLSSSGVFYLVVIKENKPYEIEDIMTGFGLKMDTVLTRRSGPELLSILKFTR